MRQQLIKCILIFPFLIILICIRTAFAVDENCDSSDGGHLGDVQCISKRIKKLDNQLNDVYERSLTFFPEKDNLDERKSREQLRRSQQAWLKYKDENCSLLGGLQGGSNLSVTYFAALCEEQQLKDRIQFMKDIIEGVYKY